ncbi:unnamed protein product (macronuclear) [Paramecium tetraurelia]|uniref:Fungal lipase-type domain-containing protein n=1 Tax=Paramecium tetraurelia TaxID=5888 RepID=A0C3N0_PARTE|nr:uncharacterized protein GSPATT00034876001 [Paramecium tetraurelia]CAK65397.1 unnamed protein product [Paramecium tetraurelia]|eukprot:XP_001432794.1 hypothetical protein (macronuclear) [Paramecium tetraurelia strain d4-2]
MKFLVVLLALAAAFDYDESLASQLTAFSFGAYCEIEDINNWNTGAISEQYPHLTKVQVFENVDMKTRGYIAYNSQTQAITVVFRGSDNIKNFIADIDTKKTNFNTACRCQVHEGFLAAYSSLKIHLDGLLGEYRVKYPYAKFHVTGHSLGGAMATLFASELAMTGVKVTLVTVGAPRVGDTDFYDWFTKLQVTHTRLTNKKDIAPHLPPFRFGFEHVNTEVWYYDGVSYVICAEVKGEDQTCSVSATRTNLNDHHSYLGWSQSSCNPEPVKQISE